MTMRVRRAIAVFQVLGFITALVTLVQSLAVTRGATLSPLVCLLLGAFLAFACASLVAGVGLWQHRRFARRLSIAIQAAQVPHVMLAGVFGYSLDLGLSLVPAIGPKPPTFMPPAHISLQVGAGAEGVYLGVNVLALVALSFLLRRRPDAVTDAAIAPDGSSRAA